MVQNVCAASRTSDGTGYGPPFGLGANQLWPRVTNGCGFLVEAIGTYILVITVLNAAVHKNSTASNAAPIAIGWAVLIAHLGKLRRGL
jgi:glycerol uptake facilitator-like aquaporin